VVRRYRQALASGDYEAAVDLLHEDLSFYPPKKGLVFGRNDLRRLWLEADDEYEHLTSEVELAEVEELPDGRCFSTTREIMRWRETGDVAATIDRGAIWRLDRGKIVEIRIFESPQAARAAVETPT